MLRKSALHLRLEERDGVPTCLIEGVVGEDAGLEEILPDIKGPTVFDLRGVQRINSTGVREWLAFIKSIDPKGPHTFTHCSVAVVSQLNMIDNFRGSSYVDSLMAPFFCEACGAEDTNLVKIRAGRPQIPAVKCPECGSTMHFDELESRYFSFLGT